MQKSWKHRLLLVVGGLLLAGGAAVLLLRFWRCPILYYTGIPCPGCGMTRAFFRLLALDFAGAAALNPLIYLLAGYVLLLAVAYITGRVRLIKSPWYWGSLIATFLLFGLWRVWYFLR